MKQKLPLLVLLYMMAILITFAQRYSSSVNGNLSAGITSEGYRVSVGAEKYITDKSSVWLNVTMNNRNASFQTLDIKANIKDWQINPRYTYYFWNFNDKIYPFISSGVFVGYETMTNRNDIPKSVIISHSNKFVYGISGTIGAELNLNKFSIFLGVDPAYDFSYKHINTAAIAGIKLYL